MQRLNHLLNDTGPTASPIGLPGRFGVDYAFISKSAVDIYVDQNKVSSYVNVGIGRVVNNHRSISSESPSCLSGCAHSHMASELDSVNL